jgi:hypothetical protein
MAELTSSTVAGSLSPTLSASQLATLAQLGKERTADLGEVLYEVGDLPATGAAPNAAATATPTAQVQRER